MILSSKPLFVKGQVVTEQSRVVQDLVPQHWRYYPQALYRTARAVRRYYSAHHLLLAHHPHGTYLMPELSRTAGKRILGSEDWGRRKQGGELGSLSAFGDGQLNLFLFLAVFGLFEVFDEEKSFVKELVLFGGVLEEADEDSVVDDEFFLGLLVLGEELHFERSQLELGGLVESCPTLFQI